MKLLVFIKDLVLSTQIRTSCEKAGFNYSSARDNQKFKEAISSGPDVAIIDLNIQNADPFLAIEDAKQSLGAEKIICFYSHVNTELAQNAINSGIKPELLYIRSKFFNNLDTIISKN